MTAPCPDDESLAALMEGRLDMTGSIATLAHLDGCTRCRELAALLGRPDAPPPPPRLGRYVVSTLIGSGGMGVVYAAQDAELGRKVALKLVRPESAHSEERKTRLLAEAQAMARLSHPNVLTVFEAGELNGEVFLAMELVEGRTLSGWLSERPRAWREVVATFVAAGRGLSAAHEAGLVHRDFKPDNVLVGSDGRPRVTDFGLSASAGFVGGSAVGTPAYLSPEQWAHPETAVVDSRSDQFAFCVALYEALYKERPFAGRTPSELQAEVLSGNVRGRPLGSKVPAAVRRALLRGLEREPAARFASMGALLDELESAAWQVTARKAYAAAAVAVVAVAGLGWGASEARRARCSGDAEAWGDAWNAGRRAEVKKAFDETGLPYAPRSFELVSRALDGVTARWQQAHHDACVAARIDGTRSDALYQRQLSCLHRARSDVAAFTRRLSHADNKAVEKAGAAADRLPRLDACADLDALARASAPRAADLSAELADVWAAEHAGQVKESIELARAVAEKARAMGDESAEAEARLAVGLGEYDRGQYNESREALRQAAWAAEASRQDELAARARVHLVLLVQEEGNVQDDVPLNEARAAIARLGGGRLEVDLANVTGTLLKKRGRCKESVASHRRALELARKLYDPVSARLAYNVSNLGNALRCAGEKEEALASQKDALAIFEQVGGPNHPDTALAQNNLAGALFSLERYGEALEYHQKALEGRRAIFGDRGALVASSLQNVGTDFVALGRHAEGIEMLQQSLAAVEREGGPRSPITLSNIGEAWLMSGQPEKGIPWLEEAIEREGPKNTPIAANARFVLAKALTQLKRDAPRAQQLAKQASSAYAGMGRTDDAKEVETWLASATH